ncbi:hypothetical protein SAMN05444166_1885 [Singulisphaera sp. GP187]|uniref:hypothetical protein n=1 Tax=Singulisphaera sp. GP187 TaxID=1882752 RepID=UPI000926567A|nr:hypothetical protein [Singulisphaera sp. GP187]SIN97947.1 hypothetical protein SAMN05444166_1885 [Singulisphaera sp. GP187]
MSTKAPDILEPSEAAARLAISTKCLTAIIRRHHYKFTELAAGGKPGDRGRRRWGLTEAQLQTIIRGQERGFEEPEPETAAPAATRYSNLPPDDGRLLLRKGKGRARSR